MSTTTNACPFCCLEEYLTTRAPLLEHAKNCFLRCDRWLYKDDTCIVTLTPEQYSRGHAIAVLRKHRRDILDEELTHEEHHALVDVIQQVGRLMKQRLSCDRVYVATLCDGIEHLHYHLIPRYSTDIKGFAFVGQREWLYRCGYRIGPEKPRERAAYLESLAKTIRSS